MGGKPERDHVFVTATATSAGQSGCRRRQEWDLCVSPSVSVMPSRWCSLLLGDKQMTCITWRVFEVTCNCLHPRSLTDGLWAGSRRNSDRIWTYELFRILRFWLSVSILIDTVFPAFVAQVTWFFSSNQSNSKRNEWGNVNGGVWDLQYERKKEQSSVELLRYGESVQMLNGDNGKEEKIKLH